VVDLAPIKQMVKNEWDWNIYDFADAIGRPREIDSYLLEKWEAFRRAMDGLRQFDDQSLTALCSPKEKK
jgi:hypothetical protein